MAAGVVGLHAQEHSSMLTVHTAPFVEEVALALDSAGRAIGQPPAYGVVLPVEERIGTELTRTGAGRVRICSDGALAVEPFLVDVRLGQGERLVLRDANTLAEVIGIDRTEVPASGRVALPRVFGPCCIVEVIGGADGGTVGTFTVAEVGHTFREVSWQKSDPCEVDVNCTEGQAFADQRDAVVRVGVRANGALIWCSGTLMNNTALDCRPFILTALHCGLNSTAADLQDYKFYFGYQRTGCGSGAADQTKYITGCHRRADSNDGGLNGSDFLLLEAYTSVPAGFDPYWAGWDASSAPSASGVTIHHPTGSEKKVSTYAMNLLTSQWIAGGPYSHWFVKWTATANGHGVTEPGSSGAPLLDTFGRVIGTLSGGTSCCVEDGCGLPGSGPDQPDYYGKMSFHWTQNPNTAAQKLKAWLDPLVLGVLALDGSRSPCAIGIEELLDEDLRVHPVPAHDRFTVRWEAPDEEMDLVLWSVGGRPLRRVRSRNGAIMEVGDLPAGSYILTLTGASGGRASHPVILVGTP
ncbi:MAG: hypothetical protein IPJ87_03250 [Flavobacteriales bacterium]|nr:hypothetical protein [Flavobacteriales bacterium]MBK7940883.1 hypothetical protein [Flavobacteriales bacterium]MBK9701694.1 hypothetical protein [Flavobacteriales bacterium]